jgi:antitoxin PrlF
MQITTKGQVTIPAELRVKFGFLPYTKIEFVSEKNRLYIKKIEKATRGEKIVAHLRNSTTIKMTTDEIMALTREN